MVMIGQTTTDDGDTVIITGHIIMTSHNSQTKKFGYIGIIPLTNVGIAVLGSPLPPLLSGFELHARYQRISMRSP